MQCAYCPESPTPANTAGQNGPEHGSAAAVKSCYGSRGSLRPPNEHEPAHQPAGINQAPKFIEEKQLMFDIASEVWDSIPVEGLRPYMTKTAERWKSIKEANGEWVGWTSNGTKRAKKSHGLGAF